MGQSMSRKINREKATQGWVNNLVGESLQNLASKFDQNARLLQADYLTQVEILEQVMIRKCGVTKEDIDSIRNEIFSRNKIDNELIKTVLRDTKLTTEEKLKKCREGAMSPNTYNEVKTSLEKQDQMRKDYEESQKKAAEPKQLSSSTESKKCTCKENEACEICADPDPGEPKLTEVID